MITAMVFMNVERDRIDDVAGDLAGLRGVSEVYSVSGKFDLLAVVRVRENDELAELVTGKLLKVKGITSSETMLAFRAYSRHDLESMFSIGAEE